MGRGKVRYVAAAGVVLASFVASSTIRPIRVAAHTTVARRVLATSTACKQRNKPAGGARIGLAGGLTQNLSPFQAQMDPAPLFDNLVALDNHLRLIPEIAERAPTVKNGDITADGKTVTFHLKHGLRWSNNSEITSSDVRFGWKVALDAATGPYCPDCTVISRIDTPDRYTAVLHFKRVYPALFSNLWPLWPSRWPGGWNNDPHAAAVKLGQDPSYDFMNSKYPTNGPYQVTRYVPNQRIVLSPMPYYRTMTCGAYLKSITYINTGSPAAAISALVAGSIDVVFAVPDPFLQALKERGSGYRVHVNPTYGFEHLEFNLDSTYQGAPNPIHDVSIRQALALAMDKVPVLQSVLPLGSKAATALEAWTPFINTPSLHQAYADMQIRGQWDPIAKRYQTKTGHGQALADAKTLLARTQWKHGLAIDLSVPDAPTRIAEGKVIVREWKQLGVNARLVTVPPNGFFGTWDSGSILYRGAFEVTLFAFAIVPDPDLLKVSFLSSAIDRRQSAHNAATNQNFAGIANHSIDRAFAQAGSTFQRSVRAKGYAVVQTITNQQAFWVPLFFLVHIWADDGHIRNLSDNASDTPVWNTWAWQLK